MAPLSAQAPAPACGRAGAQACAAYLHYLDRESGLPPDSAWMELRFLADSTEAARWFALPDAAARRDFLERFWSRRAAQATLPPEARRAEHVRRVRKAERWYGRPDRMMVAPRQQAGGLMWVTGFAARAVTPPPGRDAERYVRHDVHIDDRGLALIRYGEPDEIVPCRPHDGEVWIYRNRGQPLLLTFAPALNPSGSSFSNLKSLRDYVLAAGPGELDPGACPNRAELIERMAEYDGEYRRLFLHGGNVLAELQDDQAIDRLGQRAADRLAATEDAAPRFAAPLAGAYELLDFASDSPDTSDVTLALAVPAAPLRAGEAPDGAGHPGRAAGPRTPAGAGDDAIYAARVALSVLDGGRVLARLDTLRLFRGAGPAPSGGLITLDLPLRLPPGRYAYTLRVQAPGRPVARSGDRPDRGPVVPAAGFVHTDTLAAARLRVPDSLTLSSLALGLSRTEIHAAGADRERGGGPAGGWHRGGPSMTLLPDHALPPGHQRLALYYEVYGAADGTTLRTRIRLERKGGLPLTRRTRLDVGFTNAQRGADARVFRELDLQALRPGTYTLTLRATAEDGRSVERSTWLVLRD